MKERASVFRTTSSHAKAGVLTRWTGQRLLRGLVCLATMTMLLVGSSCSGDDDDGTSPTTERSSTPSSTTEPPGSDTAEVEPYVTELLTELDEVTDDIVRDPSAVQVAGNELLGRLDDIYAPDSPALEGALSAFRRDAEAGTRLEPLNADTTGSTRVTGAVVTVNEDTVRVPVCFEMHYRKLDRDGNVLEFVPSLNQPGEVEAVRVDGSWRLQRSDQFGNTVCEAAEPT